MFKRYLFSTSAAALIASSPALAGSPAPAPVEPVIAPVASAPAFSWAGGYAGVNVGYGGDKAKHPFSLTPYLVDLGGDRTDSDTLSGSLDMTSSGFAGGAQVGWNFQNDGFVYGVEADYQASGIKGETSFHLAAPGGSISGEIGTKLKHFGTLRARVGHTVTDRFLVYGTAGLASGKTDSYINLDGMSESVSKTKTGWTAGIGAEYAFNDNWSLKSEYMYTDLGKANLFSGDIIEGHPKSPQGLAGSLDRKFNFHMVRVGINYHF